MKIHPTVIWPVPIERIRWWRDLEAAKAKAAGAKMFMGKPEAWFDNLHWFCGNGHVSGRFLSGDRGDVCLECQRPVLMGPAIGERQFGEILNEIRPITVFIKSSKDTLDQEHIIE